MQTYCMHYNNNIIIYYDCWNLRNAQLMKKLFTLFSLMLFAVVVWRYYRGFASVIANQNTEWNMAFEVHIWFVLSRTKQFEEKICILCFSLINFQNLSTHIEYVLSRSGFSTEWMRVILIKRYERWREFVTLQVGRYSEDDKRKHRDVHYNINPVVQKVTTRYY